MLGASLHYTSSTKDHRHRSRPETRSNPRSSRTSSVRWATVHRHGAQVQLLGRLQHHLGHAQTSTERKEQNRRATLAQSAAEWSRAPRRRRVRGCRVGPVNSGSVARDAVGHTAAFRCEWSPVGLPGPAWPRHPSRWADRLWCNSRRIRYVLFHVLTGAREMGSQLCPRRPANLPLLPLASRWVCAHAAGLCASVTSALDGMRRTPSSPAWRRSARSSAGCRRPSSSSERAL